MSAVTGISGIQLSAASAAYAPTNSADVSAIASAYTTGKQDVLTFGYDGNSAISSINGSGLAGGGATGDYYEKSSTELAYGTAASASRSSFSLGGASADYLSISIGEGILGTTIATVGSISLGSNSAKNYSVALGRKASATGYSIAVGDTARAKDNSFAFAWATASSLSFAMGLNVSAKNTAMVFGKNNLKGDGDVSTGHSAAFVIGDGTAANARHDLMLVTKDGEITMYSSTADTVGTGIMSSIRALSANAGGVDSATVSAIASSYAESVASSKLDESATADFYSTSNPSSFITGVDLSDYATTAYVDSSVSSKLDTTAFNSGDFYTTSNPSGFVDSAYVDSAVSSKANSSALSSYVPYSSLEYNTASAISGINGSALAAGSTYSAGEGIDITDDVISVEAPVDIVAGPGIVVDNPDGNTLRVSTDENYETVLWEGTAASVDTAKSGLTLTESPFNFEYVEVHWVPWAYNDAGSYKQEAVVRVHLTSSFPRIGLINEWTDESNAAMFMFSVNGYFTSTKFYTTHGKWFQIGVWTVNNTGTGQYITKIVGIHRIANN